MMQRLGAIVRRPEPSSVCWHLEQCQLEQAGLVERCGEVGGRQGRCGKGQGKGGGGVGR